MKALMLRVVNDVLSHRAKEFSPGMRTAKSMLLLSYITVVHVHIEVTASLRLSNGGLQIWSLVLRHSRGSNIPVLKEPT